MVSPFFYILIFNALIIGAIFVVAKIGKSPVSIQQAIASYGSMMVIPLAMLILSLVLAMLNVFSMTLSFLLLAFAAFNVAILYTVHLFLKDSKGGLGTFYGALIVLVLIAVIFYVFGESIATSSLNHLDPMDMM
ncbi:hypothetical protein [Natribacillus halophilus]|uniref:Uncharacterized protein n=1 Tax=Natribacillus halophilus TaxID=549003 RepID=A0A1G8KDM2_9BACI|nr:hypothetical protein [Natribacillus halophilus]SDI41524.1 hypothetical protein SAMN04488123_10245 [Natribacillus halophilus]